MNGTNFYLTVGWPAPEDLMHPRPLWINVKIQGYEGQEFTVHVRRMLPFSAFASMLRTRLIQAGGMTGNVCHCPDPVEVTFRGTTIDAARNWSRDLDDVSLE